MKSDLKIALAITIAFLSIFIVSFVFYMALYIQPSLKDTLSGVMWVSGVIGGSALIALLISLDS